MAWLGFELGSVVVASIARFQMKLTDSKKTKLFWTCIQHQERALVDETNLPITTTPMAKKEGKAKRQSQNGIAHKLVLKSRHFMSCFQIVFGPWLHFGL